MSDRHFDGRKARLVAEIESPAPDASPKGTIDVQIMPLISLLNSHADVVTTSSCSGRVSVFLEGGDAASRVSGKGAGGRWLYVSHDPLDTAGRSDSELADMVVGAAGSRSGSLVPTAGSRFVHFKFETMILHILTRDRETAQAILSAALATGFRESGIMNSSGSPMAAIRSNGLALDCIVAVLDADGKVQKLVSDEYIATLVRIGNLRFEENDRRISRLTKSLEAALFQPKDEGEGKGRGETWEDREARKARKREQGLKVQEEARKEQAAAGGGDLRGEIDVGEDESMLVQWMAVGVE